MLIFKTFRFQIAPKSRKLSYWSGVWSWTEPIQRKFLCEAFKIPETQCVSEKLESPQHVFLLPDYSWFCEWCSWLLSGSTQTFIPNTTTSKYLPPACIPLAAPICSLLTLFSTRQAFPKSELPRQDYMAETLLKTHVKGIQLLLLGHLVTVALFPLLLLSNSIYTEKYITNKWFFSLKPSTKNNNTLNYARQNSMVTGHIWQYCEFFQRGNNKELKW